MERNSGYWLAPIEPDVSMLSAGEKAVHSRPVQRAERVWKAMREAAPKVVPAGVFIPLDVANSIALVTVLREDQDDNCAVDIALRLPRAVLAAIEAAAHPAFVIDSGEPGTPPVMIGPTWTLAQIASQISQEATRLNRPERSRKHLKNIESRVRALISAEEHAKARMAQAGIPYQSTPELDDLRSAVSANQPMRCQACHSPRSQSPCHKCGGELTPAAEGWEEPELPSIAQIRELAREVGYGLGVHGSLERDLDLIAIPWTTEAVSPRALAQHIADGLPGRIAATFDDAPHGRLGFNIQPEGWFKLIDLSVIGPNREADHG